jgi:hypothetical protein
MSTDIDNRKAAVYKILADIFIKVLLSIAVVIAFFVVLVNLLNPKNNYTAISLGTVETILSWTLFRVFNFYFPGKKTTKKLKK